MAKEENNLGIDLSCNAVKACTWHRSTSVIEADCDTSGQIINVNRRIDLCRNAIAVKIDHMPTHTILCENFALKRCMRSSILKCGRMPETE